MFVNKQGRCMAYIPAGHTTDVNTAALLRVGMGVTCPQNEVTSAWGLKRGGKSPYHLT